MTDFIFGILLGGILGVLFLGVWTNKKVEDDSRKDYDEE